MTKKLKELELRSEEVQEILAHPPSWMIRWGNILFLLLIILVIGLSWLIKYPDVIEAKVMVTTKIPPQKEFARISGKLDSIYVEESQIVQKNSLLAVLENSAKSEDVYYLKSLIDTIKIKEGVIDFPLYEIPILILGEVETAYANFENNYSEFELNKKLDPFNNDVIANQISLKELKVRLTSLQYQYKLNKSELSLKRNDLERNKTLLDKGVISQLDFENKQLEILESEKGIKNLSSSISTVREAISNANKNSKGTEILRTMEEAKLIRETIQSFNQLKKSIQDWENKFVLKSEINGKVSLLNYWSSNQTVSEGDLIFTVIPSDSQIYVAKLEALPQNSGKIKTGQKVNIKLHSYPETEFGILSGQVSSISLSPNLEGVYLIDVSLPDKLISSYNKEIEFRQEMQGSAEIITEDLRLLERFFYQFKSLFDY